MFFYKIFFLQIGKRTLFPVFHIPPNYAVIRENDSNHQDIFVKYFLKKSFII